MRTLNVMLLAAVAMGLSGVAALAAEPGINLNAKIVNQKVAVRVAAGNPAVVAVQAQGPINASLRLQGSHSGNCVALVEELAPGVCVPNGPGGPVSPN